jgi:hypothetical protein
MATATKRTSSAPIATSPPGQDEEDQPGPAMREQEAEPAD